MGKKRLIDATDLVRRVLEERDKIRLEVVPRYGFGVPVPDQHGQAMVGGIRKALREIETSPTVDAVEVVRKPVVGYEGYYEVDQFGRIYSVDRNVDVVDGSRVYNKKLCGKQMKQSMHTKGYKTVSLTREGKTKTEFVHRVVAKAFLPNPMNYEMINHIDEDKTNNFLENLEWCDASYNRTYGKAVEKHARKIRGIPHSEEHKRKISESVKRTLTKRKMDAEVQDGTK